MTTPHAARFYRLPTRLRVQAFWMGVVTLSAGWQLTSMITARVTPKRTEETYEVLKAQHPDGLPEDLMDQTVKLREFRDGASLSNILKTPLPGETTTAMFHELDIRKLGAQRKA